MSEYQYYEFQAIDRPLSDADRRALRALSTRARITATSFTNSYEWGDFKGDPAKLMERWFDLHLYLANWNTRRLMLRLPKRLIDRKFLDVFLKPVEDATVTVSGENLIVDILFEEVEADSEDWDDGSGWLARLAPLRAEILAGDLRLFYLLWLTAVQTGACAADVREPLPGIGPLSASLEAFVEFFDIDPDLVRAAAERGAADTGSDALPDTARRIISAMSDTDKTAMLLRLIDGDPHVAAELRAKVRADKASATGTAPVAARTAGDLRARAEAIRLARAQAAAEKRAAAQKRRAEEEEKARRARLVAIERRGESVWREVETEVERRNPAGYERAISLLLDLQVLAEEKDTPDDFLLRVRGLRERHARKGQFIKKLEAL